MHCTIFKNIFALFHLQIRSNLKLKSHFLVWLWWHSNEDSKIEDERMQFLASGECAHHCVILINKYIWKYEKLIVSPFRFDDYSLHDCSFIFHLSSCILHRVACRVRYAGLTQSKASNIIMIKYEIWRTNETKGRLAAFVFQGQYQKERLKWKMVKYTEQRSMAIADGNAFCTTNNNNNWNGVCKL